MNEKLDYAKTLQKETDHYMGRDKIDFVAVFSLQITNVMFGFGYKEFD